MKLLHYIISLLLIVSIIGCNYQVNYNWPVNRNCVFHNVPLSKILKFDIDSLIISESSEFITLNYHIYVENISESELCLPQRYIYYHYGLLINDSLINFSYQRNKHFSFMHSEEWYRLDTIPPKGRKTYKKYFDTPLNDHLKAFDKKGENKIRLRFLYEGGIVINDCWYKLDSNMKLIYIYENYGKEVANEKKEKYYPKISNQLEIKIDN